MTYQPADTRYDKMPYRPCGRSGLKLPAISLGLWHNFGEDRSLDSMKQLCRTAFDGGITHFDLANNYGPPPGSAETAFGDILRSDFAGLRDELVISSKAGYRMWPGPYGEFGSRKSMLASLDQSLRRMGLDYVDIFYSHRFHTDAPLAETMGALDAAVRQGKALYVGVSSYNARRTAEAAAILKQLGTPCVIHQPSYSLLNRWVEQDGLLDTLEQEGIGVIAFAPLAQGLLTGRYLAGIPADSRAAQGKSLDPAVVSADNLERVRGLAAVAERRGQSLAQMALAWVLRGGRVTSALIGASRPEQITECIGAVGNIGFSDTELAEIDRFATDGAVNIWRESAELDG